MLESNPFTKLSRFVIGPISMTFRVGPQQLHYQPIPDATKKVLFPAARARLDADRSRSGWRLFTSAAQASRTSDGQRFYNRCPPSHT
jgi:hypothetical protein